jgi:hypothetical protein
MDITRTTGIKAANDTGDSTKRSYWRTQAYQPSLDEQHGGRRAWSSPTSKEKLWVISISFSSILVDRHGLRSDEHVHLRRFILILIDGRERRKPRHTFAIELRRRLCILTRGKRSASTRGMYATPKWRSLFLRVCITIMNYRKKSMLITKLVDRGIEVLSQSTFKHCRPQASLVPTTT